MTYMTMYQWEATVMDMDWKHEIYEPIKQFHSLKNQRMVILLSLVQYIVCSPTFLNTFLYNHNMPFWLQNYCLHHPSTVFRNRLTWWSDLSNVNTSACVNCPPLLRSFRGHGRVSPVQREHVLTPRCTGRSFCCQAQPKLSRPLPSHLVSPSDLQYGSSSTSRAAQPARQTSCYHAGQRDVTQTHIITPLSELRTVLHTPLLQTPPSPKCKPPDPLPPDRPRRHSEASYGERDQFRRRSEDQQRTGPQ